MKPFIRLSAALFLMLFHFFSCSEKDVVPLSDPLFRTYCLNEFDSNLDGKLSLQEAAAVKIISCPQRGIVSLSGLQYFTSLKDLYCSDNQLEELDISRNPMLQRLACQSNRLKKLDVSNNPLLTHLVCENNLLNELDVTRNPALEYLLCSNNRLTVLDLSNNPGLKYLWCWCNRLSALDISRNPLLENLGCMFNQLQSLDLCNNENLTFLDCTSNMSMKEIYIRTSHKMVSAKTDVHCTITYKP